MYQDQAVQLLQGDVLAVLKTLPDEYVQMVVTSPPYWGLQDYKVAGQIGLEKTPEEYLAKIVEVFREVRRVLKDDGTIWLNLGDSYANDTKWGGKTGGKHAKGLHGEPIGRGKRTTGLKAKDLVGIPWMVAFALRADGWYLRSDIIWAKPNPMPESVTDRPTKAHEYLFLLSKRERYYYDAEAIKEPATGWHDSEFHTGKTGDHQLGRAQKHRATFRGGGSYVNNNSFNNSSPVAPTDTGMERISKDDRNKRSVWTVATQPYADAHFATFPEKLIEPCILAGAPAGGLVLDLFSGAGTTLLVAKKLNRTGIGIELSPECCAMSAKRLSIEPARML